MTSHTLKEIQMTTQFKAGDKVTVTAARGGLFHSRNEGKTGVVTKVVDDLLYATFDGEEDYGYTSNVKRATPKFKQGDRVKVVAPLGGVFYMRHAGKEGTVTRFNDGESVYVRFDESGEVDYGSEDDVVKIEAPAADEGWTSNDYNTRGVLPATRGTLMDIKYNDGTIILDLPIGTGEAKRSINKPGNSYSASTFTYTGRGSATIVAYRLASARPGATTGRRVTHAEMVKGMQVKLVDEGEGHTHWGFKLGGVYTCRDRAPMSPSGQGADRNWAGWVWEVVAEADTLDTQLAALRAELDAIKVEKQAAEAEVAAARVKVNGIEAKRVALVERLTRHGIKFISE
jgi:ribosomal protein L21E